MLLESDIGGIMEQVVKFIRSIERIKQDQANKERRHKVDREIRKVLEEKQL